MEQVLYQQQKLKLIVTHQMEQQLSLLHMPLIDLESYIIDQALENPLIDMNSIYNEYTGSKKYQYDNQIEQDWFHNIEQPQNMYDYLVEQMGYLKLHEQDKTILRYLIFLVDEDGYIREDLHLVAEHFSVSHEVVKRLLGQLQTFEPIGIGARNLQECLLIQLQNMENRNELAEEIVSHYFAQFINRKWKEISQQLSVAVTEIQFVFDLLSSLDPRPGSSFFGSAPQPIIPELVVVNDINSLKVMINDSLYPKLQFDSYYQGQLKRLPNKEDSTFLKEKYHHFNWLKQAIDKRKITLVKVMNAIVDRQYKFFQEGIKYLKPLTIKEIAEAINLHESTVSRAVNGKYVQTPQGLFELKYFFTSSIGTVTNNEASSEVVKRSICALIDKENKQKPISDQKIVDLLGVNYGYNLSRRTVTKYREQLGIPSSSKRRRF